MERTCEGKVAIVTGASRGLGEAIAKRLASEGARVVLSARTVEPDPKYVGSLQETAADIAAAGGEAIAIRCDLSRHDDRVNLVAETQKRLGPVDILVNNGAVTWIEPMLGFTEKKFRLMTEVQVWAPYELSQLVVPSMIERGGGHILNITSRSSVHPIGPPFPPVHEQGFSVYGMVKAGLDRITTAFAAELHPHNVRVNALAPWDNVATSGASAHDLVDDFPLESADLIAEAALILCSGPPEMTGRIAYSQPFLAEVKRRPGQY